MHYVIGIDEAGRGAWAGPIVAGGFMMQKRQFENIREIIPKVADSKKLSKKEREDIYSTIEYLTHKNECQYAFAYRDAEVIDTVGIREANRSCMEDIILSFLQYIHEDDTLEIWIDGCDNYTFSIDDFHYFFAKKKSRKSKIKDDIQLMGSRGNNLSKRGGSLPIEEQSEYQASFVPLSSFGTFCSKSTEEITGEGDENSAVTEIQNTRDDRSTGLLRKLAMTEKEAIKNRTISYLINGDNLLAAISLGSIIAKVIRDRMMCEYNEDFPLYGFESHVGYGTRKHMDALYDYNITPIHRKSYAPVKRLISPASSI